MSDSRVPVQDALEAIPRERIGPSDDEIEARRKSAEESQEKSRRVGIWKQIIERRGVRYAKCQLDGFDAVQDEFMPKRKAAVGQVWKFCRELAAGGSVPNLVFAGPAGTGKDHLLFYTLRTAVIQHGMNAEWIDGQALFGSIRDAISNGDAESTIVGPLVRADVLAISDPVPPLGSLSDHQRNILFRVLDGRYAAMRPTWATVNAENPKELDERMGVQLVDRLLDDAVKVNCFWPSYRRKPR